MTDEPNTTDPHPDYGSCDSIRPDGSCAECHARKVGYRGPDPNPPEMTLEDEVRAHFNEPVLAIRGLGRVIGYSEDESDCYIIIRHLGGKEIHHSMVGGYYWLNRLRGQNYVKSIDGEDWDDLFRLDSLLERSGSPKATAFRCHRFIPDVRE